MKHVVVGAVAGVVAGLFLGFAGGRLWFGTSGGDDQMETAESAPAPEQASDLVRLDAEQIQEFGIETTVAGPGELQVELQLPGQIVLNADKLAWVSPRVSGVVVAIRKTLGDAVGKDEVMAVLDSRELAEAKAAYLTAIQQEALRRTDFDREAKLWDKRVSAEEDYIDAKQALAEAGIATSNAKQSLRALGCTEEELAKLPEQSDHRYRRYEIRAPFDGTVIDKQVTLGQPVNDIAPLFRIADLRTVWVDLNIREEDLGRVPLGQTVVVQAATTAGRAKAAVEYISPLVSESTRTATVRAVLDNRNGLWRPGTFVTGLVNVEPVPVAVMVPLGAIQDLGGQDVVFVQTDSGFRPQPVETGREDSHNVEVTRGLEPGRRYVGVNAFTLKAELSKSSFAGDDD